MARLQTRLRDSPLTGQRRFLPQRIGWPALKVSRQRLLTLGTACDMMSKAHSVDIIGQGHATFLGLQGMIREKGVA